MRVAFSVFFAALLLLIFAGCDSEEQEMSANEASKAFVLIDIVEKFYEKNNFSLPASGYFPVNSIRFIHGELASSKVDPDYQRWGYECGGGSVLLKSDAYVEPGVQVGVIKSFNAKGLNSWEATAGKDGSVYFEKVNVRCGEDHYE